MGLVDNDVVDVLVLGAGWSGLLACKYSLAAGLKTTVLESRDTIGGVWAYTSDRRFGGVMSTTETTSSRCITEMSDFPMPSDYPDFPSHAQVLDYLKAYAGHFGLNEHVQLNRTVSVARKDSGVWAVECTDGSRYRARHLVVTSGVHQYPKDMSADARFSGFTGALLHSAAIKGNPREATGKTVVIWGGGESASDIAAVVSNDAARVYWCIPNGQWFVPKVVDRWPPFPSNRRKVVDHTSSRLRLILSPTHRYSPFISQYLSWTFGFNGHGQEPWRTDAPYNRSFFNKSSEALSLVRSGRIVPRRDVSHSEGRDVHFSDGSSVAADLIITCSGYKTAFPFLPDSAAVGTDPRRWYKHIFYNEDTTLAFVGFARPIFGSIPGLAELQARYVAAVYSGRRSLPGPEQRELAIRRDADFWGHHFRYTSQRLRGLVDHFIYSKDLARLIGCEPALFRLLLASPSKWWAAVSSPWNGCQFWLHDRSHHERIFQTLGRYRDNQVSEIYFFLLLAPVLPIIGLATYFRIFLWEKFARRRPERPSSATGQTVGRDNSAALDRAVAAECAHE